MSGGVGGGSLDQLGTQVAPRNAAAAAELPRGGTRGGRRGRKPEPRRPPPVHKPSLDVRDTGSLFEVPAFFQISRERESGKVKGCCGDRKVNETNRVSHGFAN